MDKDKADKFLSELKELIEKYNASIFFNVSYCYDGVVVTDLDIYIKNKLVATLSDNDELSWTNFDTLRRVYE